ncbi:MAG: DsbA family protein [Sphingomonadales bacterium]|nr:DsbA family protein [Sphingomonadales bacterium]
MTKPASRPALPMVLSGIALLLAGAATGWIVARTGGGGMGAGMDKAAVEEVVRNYILEHPEILPEAMENLRQRETGKQLAATGGKLEQPFPGMVLGNPNGSVVLVEFTDFACGYCRASVPEVEALIAANPDLKIVVRELPIIAPTSADAARWALAAAEQGKFPAFHKAMFAAGRTDAASIEGAARAAGLDLDRARQFIKDPRVEAELKTNIDLARQLGIDGTPSWVVGDQLLAGAVGRDVLGKAIAAARSGNQ